MTLGKLFTPLWPVTKQYNLALLVDGLRYGDSAGNTVEENSSIFSLIRMR